MRLRDVPVSGGLLAILILSVGEALACDTFYATLPTGLRGDAARVPSDNPLTADKIALGKQFFWDRRWSASGTVACASCHRSESGWSDSRRLSINFAGQPTPRHAPTIINRLFSEQQLWTGLRTSLEDQAANDSNQNQAAVVDRLGAIPEYRRAFKKVFDTELNADGVAKAIAAYVRTIVSGNSAYDRFVAGERGAMSIPAQRGRLLFEGKARCQRCHAGFNFTDERYWNIGVGMQSEAPDLGRYLVTQQEADKGAFKTPTLRDVVRRGPYMHDGSQQTLRDVVAFYNRGGHPNPWLSPETQALSLRDEEQEDLVAFLEALTGEIPAEVATAPDLPPSPISP